MSAENKKGAKGILGAGVVAAIVKGGAFLGAHLGLIAKPAAVGHIAADAAHVAPALIHDGGNIVSHALPLVKTGGEAVVEHSNLVEDGAKTFGKAAAKTVYMSDGERIARSAGNVVRTYGRQGIRSVARQEKDEEKKP